LSVDESGALYIDSEVKTKGDIRVIFGIKGSDLKGVIDAHKKTTEKEK